jgi:hypothetical protein
MIAHDSHQFSFHRGWFGSVLMFRKAVSVDGYEWGWSAWRSATRFETDLVLHHIDALNSPTHANVIRELTGRSGSVPECDPHVS